MRRDRAGVVRSRLRSHLRDPFDNHPGSEVRQAHGHRADIQARPQPAELCESCTTGALDADIACAPAGRDLLEGIVLHAFEGKPPFGAESLAKIATLREVYGLERAPVHIRFFRANLSSVLWRST